MAKAQPEKSKRASLRESFASFLADPSRDKLRELFQTHGGEFKDLDFKREWPDKDSVAKQVLALGNIGGGVLVVGVEESTEGSLTPVGLECFLDKDKVIKPLLGPVPTVLVERTTVHDFEYPGGEWGNIAGLKFQVLIVEPDPDHMPFIAQRDTGKLTRGGIYVRRDGGVDIATYEEVQSLINRRIGSGYSSQAELSLKQHLEQLKVLYEELQPNRFRSALFANGMIATMRAFTERNPSYPVEDFDDFVKRMVDAKKGLVEKTLGL